jgi:hypothetical protein
MGYRCLWSDGTKVASVGTCVLTFKACAGPIGANVARVIRCASWNGRWSRRRGCKTPTGTSRGVDGGDSAIVQLLEYMVRALRPRVARFNAKKVPQVHYVSRKGNVGRCSQKYVLYRALQLCATPLSSILDKVAHTIPLHVMKLCGAYRVCHSASKHH